MEVPSETRVSEMRDRLFRRNRFARKKLTDNRRSRSISDSGADKECAEGCACGMTKQELEEMAIRIISEPMKSCDKESTYEIHKTKTGVIIIRRNQSPEERSRDLSSTTEFLSLEDNDADARAPIANVPDNDGEKEQIWKVNMAHLMTGADPDNPENVGSRKETIRVTNEESDAAPKEEGAGEVGHMDMDPHQEHEGTITQRNEDAEDETRVSNSEQDRDSAFGNDPPASDQAPVRGTHGRWRSLHFDGLEWETHLQNSGDPRYDHEASERRGENEGNGRGSIKGRTRGQPHSIDRSEPQAPNTLKTSTSHTSQYHPESTDTLGVIPFAQLPANPTPLDDLVNQHEMTARFKSYDSGRVPPEVGDPRANSPQLPDQTPALLYASNLVPAKQRGSHPGTSFEGFECILVRGRDAHSISGVLIRKVILLRSFSSRGEKKLRKKGKIHPRSPPGY